ncbi:MAG: YchJ family protein [Elusimicrobiota bacterium]
MTATTACPCDSGKEFLACCEPYVAGKALAPTAEALMRARYTSYATGRVDFIEKTHAPESRADFDRKASEKWAKESTWHGLKIVATKGGGEKDSTGVVSFVARFSTGGEDFEHREIATFRREGGNWFFVDGKSPKPETFVKSGPDVGRNDPCHCGSGKKFKKCHGKD